MAAPQATFQPIQAYYQYHPIVYNPLPNQHLEPVNWMASLGTASMEGAKMLQQSYLNPYYKQQAITEMQRMQMARTDMDYAKKRGEDYIATYGSVGPEGYGQAPMAGHYNVAVMRGDIPIQTKPADQPQGNGQQGGDDAAKKQAALDAAKAAAAAKGETYTGEAPPTPTSTGKQFGGSDSQQTGQHSPDLTPLHKAGQTYYSPDNPNFAANAPAAPTDPASLDARISNLENAIYTPGQGQGPNFNFPQGPDPYQSSYQQPYFASQGGPVPQRFQGGGPVSGPAQPPQQPQDAPVPQQTPTPQSIQQNPAFQAALQGTGSSPEAIQAFQQSQLGNLHPVVPATAVRDALKQIHTGVKDVVYNVGSGPGGQPSYTVHTKDPGGSGVSSTTIPLTNIAKFFPNLVSSSNMGLAMQGAEMQGSLQPQPQQQQQPQQNPVWSPFGNQQPFGGTQPPGAPGPVTDAQNAALRNAVGQQISNPQNLSASNNSAAIPTKTDKVNNPSNVGPEMMHPDSVHDAAPFPASMNDQLTRVEQASKNLMANKDALNNQPNGYDEGTKEAYNKEGYTWFVDTNPMTSHVPYIVTGVTPSTTFRHYATGEQGEYPLSDGKLKDQVLNLVHTDPTNMTHNQLMDALQDYNWRTANGGWSKQNEDKVEALTYQVLHTQRALDSARALNTKYGPSGWNPLLAINNEIYNNRQMWGGPDHPAGEQIIKGLTNLFSGGHGAPDPNLTYFVKAWNKMHDASAMSALEGPERSDLNQVHWDDRLIPDLEDYLNDQGARMNRYISQGLHNNEKVDLPYIDNAKSFRNFGRIPDTGLDADDYRAATNASNPGVHAVSTPTPRSTPTPSPTPARDYDIDVRGMSHDQLMKAIEGQSGKRVIDGTGRISILR